MASNVLKNAVTLVTGGASGLGKATVERFVGLGSRVVLCDLPSSQGGQVAKGLGDNCLFVPVDVNSESDVRDAMKTTESKFGRLDNLVNCAGVAVACRTYNFTKNKMHPMDSFNNTLLTNVSGTFNMICHATLLMNENEGNEDGQRGVIINTSSIAAYDGQIGQAAYAASKGAISAMTLPLARDLGARGIRVVTIAPGLFETPMLAGLPDVLFDPFSSGLFETPMLAGLPEKVQKFLASTCISPNRLGKPDEYAQLCQSIVENRMLNAEVIRLDAGVRMMP